MLSTVGALDSLWVLFLTKLLPVFVYPLGMAIVLIVIGCLALAASRVQLGRAALATAIAGLWIASTPSFADWSLGTLERQFPPIAIEKLPNADVAIVLGGAVGSAVPPRVTLDLSAAADRVLWAARLFRAGKVERILVSGGNIPWLPGTRPEAEVIRDLLIEWRVPPSAILIASGSRNTFENAMEIAALRQRDRFATALLVTSAFHMPRALAVFRKAGLPVTPATTDVEVVDPGPWTVMRWLPDAHALAQTTKATKEWIGYWAYWARGYI